MRHELLVERVDGDGVGRGGGRGGPPGKFAVIIAMPHGTSAPALKGNVRRRSDWFIARYAQTTPMTNVPTSDQPILDLRRAQDEIHPQSYLRFAFNTCVSDH